MKKEEQRQGCKGKKEERGQGFLDKVKPKGVTCEQKGGGPAASTVKRGTKACRDGGKRKSSPILESTTSDGGTLGETKKENLVLHRTRRNKRNARAEFGK